MEEYDDLAKGPDEDGNLNLSYSDFQTIPYDICNEYNKRLISLNLSYNNLTLISEQIRNLTLLKELNLSHNKLTSIDKALGHCIRLRKLDLSHNQISSIPDEIFQRCRLLDTINLSNNILKSIPFDVCELKALEVLDIRQNKLVHVPTELHLIQCLKTFNCDGNSKLETIPRAMQQESELSLWTLKFHHVYKDQINLAIREYEKLENETKKKMIETTSMEEEVCKLYFEVQELERERPSKYIERKATFMEFRNKCHSKWTHFIAKSGTCWKKVFKRQE